MTPRTTDLTAAPYGPDPGASRSTAHAQGEDGLSSVVAALEVANAELRRSNAELMEFASIAAHELRAPLQTITGFAELLEAHAGESLDITSSDYLRGIRRGAERLHALVEALLTYARVGTDVRRREEVDCGDLINTICDALAVRISETAATVTAEGSLPVLVADAAELEQLFQNLIANAITYCRAGVEPRIRIAADRMDRMWQFVVADNGIGIDPRYRERVFRVFQRLPGSDMGTRSGIGLAVCKRIVEGHGGRIWAEENSGGGTRMCFTLPAPVCWSPF